MDSPASPRGRGQAGRPGRGRATCLLRSRPECRADLLGKLRRKQHGHVGLSIQGRPAEREGRQPMMRRTRALAVVWLLAAGPAGRGEPRSSFALPAATALGTLAASMQAGTWAELATTNLANAPSFADHGRGHPSTIVGDAKHWAWDP